MHQQPPLQFKEKMGGQKNWSCWKATGTMERSPASEDEKHRDFELLEYLYDVLSDFFGTGGCSRKLRFRTTSHLGSLPKSFASDLPLTGPEFRPEFGINKTPQKNMESPAGTISTAIAHVLSGFWSWRLQQKTAITYPLRGRNSGQSLGLIKPPKIMESPAGLR